MTDNTNSAADEPKHSDQTQSVSTDQQSVPPTSPQPAPPAQVHKSTGKGLSVVAILFSLAALGGTGFSFYQDQIANQGAEGKLLTSVNGIGSDVKVLAERMNQLQRQQASVEQNSVSPAQLKSDLLQVSSTTEAVAREVKADQQALKATLEKLAANTERGADRLALEEVSQLLKLANNSVVFANDRNSALGALRLADSQLQRLADPRYAVVRRTIGEEIATLEAVETIDISSATANINTVAKRIPSLPLENEPPVVSNIDVTPESESEELSIKSELQKAWYAVVDSVKVKRVDEPPKPLLEPEQRYFLDQNIQLKLSTAELAVMQNQPQIYQRNIDEALTWLLDYYDPRDEGVKDVAEKLRALKAQPLGAQLPAIAGSYDQLQRIIGGN